MKQFSSVGVFALDPQKNFESHGASRRSRHRSLLSQMVAGLGPVAVDEFLRGHAALALELNVDQLQRRGSVFALARARGAANEQPRSLDCDFSRRQNDRMLPQLSTVHLQRFTFKDGECPRPRLKTAQAVEQIGCRARKI